MKTSPLTRAQSQGWYKPARQWAGTTSPFDSAKFSRGPFWGCHLAMIPERLNVTVNGPFSGIARISTALSEHETVYVQALRSACLGGDGQHLLLESFGAIDMDGGVHAGGVGHQCRDVRPATALRRPSTPWVTCSAVETSLNRRAMEPVSSHSARSWLKRTLCSMRTGLCNV